MDSALKALLTAPADGQIEIAEEQVRPDASLKALAEGQARADAAVTRLADGQDRPTRRWG